MRAEGRRRRPDPCWRLLPTMRCGSVAETRRARRDYTGGAGLMCICTSLSCPRKNTDVEHSNVLCRIVVIRVRIHTRYTPGPQRGSPAILCGATMGQPHNVQRVAALTAFLPRDTALRLRGRNAQRGSRNYPERASREASASGSREHGPELRANHGLHERVVALVRRRPTPRGHAENLADAASLPVAIFEG